jgi:DNA-binding CsgD family transcriptional regulator
MESLSFSDLQRIAAVGDVLVSPSLFPTIKAWRHAAHVAVANLISSDMSAFVLPFSRDEFIVCDDDVRRAATEWEQEFQFRDPGYIKSRAERQLTVFHHTDVYDMAEYLLSDEYQEWVRPHRLFEAFAMAVPLPNLSVPASINCYRSDPTSPYGARERTILQLLFPMFRAGVASLVAGQAHRASIDLVLRATDSAAVLLSEDGTTQHETEAATRLIESIDAPAIRAALLALARATLDPPLHSSSSSVHRIRRNPTASLVLGGVQTIVARGRQITLTPTVMPAHDVRGARSVLITLSSRDRPISDEQLQIRYQLTPREIAVARALGTTQDVSVLASQLKISIHTFRRHTERVYAKLRVRSRIELSQRLAVADLTAD